MDSKNLQRSKRQKKSKQSKDKGNPEVFVLSPDLLKKLGISIGNVSSSTQPMTDGFLPPSTPKIHTEKESNASRNLEKVKSSILETASLMKKSVFLSPTFIPTATGIDSGDFEIGEDNIGEPKALSNFDKGPINDLNIEQEPHINISVKPVFNSNENYSEILNDKIIFKQPTAMNNNIFEHNCNDIEIEIIDKSRSNSSIQDDLLCGQVTKNPEIEVHSYISISNHDRELPCKSNAETFEISSRKSNSKLEAAPSKSSKNKINIISEEIIHLSKLKEVKNKSTKTSKLTPVTVNTVITAKKTNDDDTVCTLVAANNIMCVERSANTDIVKMSEQENLLINKSNENETISHNSYPISENHESLPIKEISNSHETISLTAVSKRIENIHDKVDYLNTNLSLIDSEINMLDTITNNQNIELNGYNEIDEINFEQSIKSGLPSSKITKKINPLEHIVNGSTDIKAEINTNQNCNSKVNGDTTKYDNDSDHNLQPCRISNIDIVISDRDKKGKVNKIIPNGNVPPISPVQNTCSMNENRKKKENNISQDKNNIQAKSDSIDPEKVKELSNYLRQIYWNKRNKSSKDKDNKNANNSIKDTDSGSTGKHTEKDTYKNTNSNDKNNHGNDECIQEKVIANSNILKSKLSIQGVEKPGGNHDDEICFNFKQLKNKYSKRKSDKHLNTAVKEVKNSDAPKIIKGSDEVIDTCNNAETTISRNTFCICYDYGRLSYYECDDFYEHIHFRIQNATNSAVEDIFSIYHDNDNEPSADTKIQEIEKKENLEEIVYNICWHDLERSIANETIAGQKEDYEIGSMSTSDVDCILTVIKIVDEEEDVAINNTQLNLSDDGDKNDSKMRTRNSIAGKLDALDLGETSLSSTNILQNSAEESVLNDHAITTSSDNATKKNTTESTAKNINEVPDNVCEVPIEDSISEQSKNTYSRRAAKRGSSTTDVKKRRSTKTDPHNEQINSKSESNVNKQELHVKSDNNILHDNVGTSPKKVEVSESEQNVNILDDSGKKRRGRSKKMSMEQKPKEENSATDNNTINIKIIGNKQESNTLAGDNDIEESRSQPIENKVSEQPIAIQANSVSGQLSENFVSKKTNEPSVVKKGRGRSRKRPMNLDDSVDEQSRILDHSVAEQSSLLEISIDNINVEQQLENSAKRKRTERSTYSEDTKTYICGVCKEEVPLLKWYQHIGKEHKYLAWEHGTEPLDLNDKEAVHNHLAKFISTGGLICYKCGLTRKRVKNYLAHIESCDGDGTWANESTAAPDLNSTVADLNRSGRRLKQAEPEVKCGVCQKVVTKDKWLRHIGKKHHYKAWEEGATPLNVNSEEDVRDHLMNIIRRNDYLECFKCGFQRKRVNLYLLHIKSCNRSVEDDEEDTEQVDTKDGIIDKADDCTPVKCGVCSQEMMTKQWVEHIGKEHNYLAWQEGADPLNLEDQDAVRDCLKKLLYQNGGLICHKCGISKKYAKTYLSHVESCKGETQKNTSIDDSQAKKPVKRASLFDLNGEVVTCGVCKQQVEPKDWIEHIQLVHNYLAWIDGQEPVNIEDEDEVHNYLYDVSKSLGGLTCGGCGLVRKYVKTYLVHAESCQSNTIELHSAFKNKESVECAVCGMDVPTKQWREHAMKEHYNVAWVVGETPIDINAPYTVEPYIKEYWNKHKKLVCKQCGTKRMSAVGFYAHIIQCGKTDEEMEVYKGVCDICNNKYLKIYKSQHMTAHREAELSCERKKHRAEQQAFLSKVDKEEAEGEVLPGGKRKAAAKANDVILKYKNNLKEAAHYCSKCSLSTDVENEFVNHVCVEDGSHSDSDVSINFDSDHESSESDIDSNVSEQEEQERQLELNAKKRKSGESSSLKPSKCPKLPYSIPNVPLYMKTSTEEFIATYLTDEDLFPQWRNIQYEILDEDSALKYMPPIEESCYSRFNTDTEFNACPRLQTKRNTGNINVSFVGAIIGCISWVPHRIDKELAPKEDHYLAVACYLGTDAPRHNWYDTPEQKGLIQIWNFYNTLSLAEFALGIVHDYGAVWAMDWCPSGARDILDPQLETHDHRLGLLAIACSNGFIYILPVPYPPKTTGDNHKRFYRIKPIAELRLVTKTTDRNVCQATAVKWSKQKGHSNIVVGYSDGTLAYYDLFSESPLLRTVEDGVIILYPYHDDRPLNATIDCVDVYPSMFEREGAGVVAAGGAVGAAARGGAGGAGGGAGGGARSLHLHTAAPHVVFPPHWPAALLAGDDSIVNLSVNEMEWLGYGRRLGGMGAASGCPWCGKFVASTPPLLRTMRPHPAHTDIYKQVIATLQMKPLDNKPRKKNDELSMVVEPITYEEAIKKYGVEFKQVVCKNRPMQQKYSAMPKEVFPERYPLSDIVTMAFCPTLRNHGKIAIALHSGLILLVTV